MGFWLFRLDYGARNADSASSRTIPLSPAGLLVALHSRHETLEPSDPSNLTDVRWLRRLDFFGASWPCEEVVVLQRVPVSRAEGGAFALPRGVKDWAEPRQGYSQCKLHHLKDVGCAARTRNR